MPGRVPEMFTRMMGREAVGDLLKPHVRIYKPYPEIAGHPGDHFPQSGPRGVMRSFRLFPSPNFQSLPTFFEQQQRTRAIGANGIAHESVI